MWNLMLLRIRECLLKAGLQNAMITASTFVVICQESYAGLTVHEPRLSGTSKYTEEQAHIIFDEILI